MEINTRGETIEQMKIQVGQRRIPAGLWMEVEIKSNW